MVNFVSFLVNIDMTVLFLFHSSPQLFQFLYFLSFRLFFSFVNFSIALHQVSSYFLFIFYSPVVIFFLFFPTASVTCKLVYFFSFVRTLLGLCFAILSSILFFSSFHRLHLHPSVLLHSFHPSVLLLVSSLSSHHHIFSSIFLPPYFFLSFHFHTFSIFLLSSPHFPFSYFSFPLLKLPGSEMIALKSIKVYVSVSHLCLPF